MYIYITILLQLLDTYNLIQNSSPVGAITLKREWTEN